MDCFVALHRIIRVVAGVTSGSNLRVSLRYTLPKIRPRNDVKCAALSLAALNDFVSKANKTSVHLVKAMPQAAQKFCVFFSLPSFAVESSARNVQNGFTLSFGRERFVFSAWLFAYYEFQSIALRQRSSLYAHNPLFTSQSKRENEQ